MIFFFAKYLSTLLRPIAQGKIDPFQTITALPLPLNEKFGWRRLDACYYIFPAIAHGSRNNF